MSSNFRATAIIYRPLVLALLLASLLAVVGCSRVSQEAQHNQLQIELVEPLFPPAVGKDTLNIRLFDANDNPINDATIAIKADMTHAGMVPILGDATEGDKGLYKVPFEWSMGGDWVVVVQATLPDGTVAEETFPITISGDTANCDDEATKSP
jgi:hypothetical protein